ncbi:MAG TPA: hypothetical protein VM580_28690 [Labilithrix sp.]|nr:hypothetical protein [Labilithrix sp.]
MLFGLTRGEIVLVLIIFGLIYLAGLLPKIAARMTGGQGEANSGRAEGVGGDGGRDP